MATLMCLCFMLCWTPYAIVSLLYMNGVTVHNTLTVAAPFFAKSGTLYNPVIYFLLVKRFRKDVVQVFRLCWKEGYSRSSTDSIEVACEVTYKNNNQASFGLGKKYDALEMQKVKVRDAHALNSKLQPIDSNPHVSEHLLSKHDGEEEDAD